MLKKQEEWALFRIDAGKHPETKEWKVYVAIGMLKWLFRNDLYGIYIEF